MPFLNVCTSVVCCHTFGSDHCRAQKSSVCWTNGKFSLDLQIYIYDIHIQSDQLWNHILTDFEASKKNWENWNQTQPEGWFCLQGLTAGYWSSFSLPRYLLQFPSSCHLVAAHTGPGDAVHPVRHTRLRIAGLTACEVTLRRRLPLSDTSRPGEMRQQQHTRGSPISSNAELVLWTHFVLQQITNHPCWRVKMSTLSIFQIHDHHSWKRRTKTLGKLTETTTTCCITTTTTTPRKNYVKIT